MRIMKMWNDLPVSSSKLGVYYLFYWVIMFFNVLCMVMVYQLSLVAFLLIAASGKYCCGWFQWWEAYFLWFWNDGKVPFFTQMNGYLNSPQLLNLMMYILPLVLFTSLANLQYQSEYQGRVARSILWSLWERSRQG